MNRAASGANETLTRIVSGNFKTHWCSALRTEFHANDFLQIGIAGESAILLLIMPTHLLTTSRHVLISRPQFNIDHAFRVNQARNSAVQSLHILHQCELLQHEV